MIVLAKKILRPHQIKEQKSKENKGNYKFEKKKYVEQKKNQN